MDPLLQRALEIANRPRATHRPDQRVPSESANEEIVIEPAHPQARPIFWEKADGSIWGPATPEFLARVGNGPKASYWVVAEFEGLPVWINSAALRSKSNLRHRSSPWWSN